MTGWAQRQAEEFEEREAYRDGLEKRIEELEADRSALLLILRQCRYAILSADKAHPLIAVIDRLDIGS